MANAQPEQINQLVLELENVERQLRATQQKCRQLAEMWHSTYADWQQRVIAIGQAITASKAAHGAGWKRDYKSHGFSFSYTIACRYISCADHPVAGGEAASVEAWAKSATDFNRVQSKAESTKEAERIKKAEARRLKATQSLENLVAHDEPVPNASTEFMAPVNSHLKNALDNCCGRDQMQESFDLLHDAIGTDPRLEQLRPLWRRLLEGLEEGWVPHIRAVSPDYSDDTVESGGEAIASDLAAQLVPTHDARRDHRTVEAAGR